LPPKCFHNKSGIYCSFFGSSIVLNPSAFRIVNLPENSLRDFFCASRVANAFRNIDASVCGILRSITENTSWGVLDSKSESFVTRIRFCASDSSEMILSDEPLGAIRML
jgi:hypothetical protein